MCAHALVCACAHVWVCVCVCVCVVKVCVCAHAQAWTAQIQKKGCVPDACNNDAIACAVQERAHKHALQRVLRADAFALEHKRVNDWDLSYAMATFANQYRQELRSAHGSPFLSFPFPFLSLLSWVSHMYSCKKVEANGMFMMD